MYVYSRLSFFTPYSLNKLAYLNILNEAKELKTVEKSLLLVNLFRFFNNWGVNIDFFRWNKERHVSTMEDSTARNCFKKKGSLAEQILKERKKSELKAIL